MRRMAHECAIRRNALAAFAYLASLPRPPRPGGAWPGIWLRAGVTASVRAGWLEIRKTRNRWDRGESGGHGSDVSRDGVPMALRPHGSHERHVVRREI